MADTKKHFISNRFGLEIVVYVTEPENPIGTVVMSHGLSSSSNRPLFIETTQAFLEAGYRVVRYDATHALGASAGDPSYCTMTSLKEDLSDVLRWMSQQRWMTDKLILMGHSLGAMTAGLHVAHAHIFVSAVSDGELSFECAWTPQEIDDWKAIGYVERGQDAGYHRLRWSHYADRCQYSILEAKFNHVLLVCGTEDSDRPGTDALESALLGNGDSPIRLDLEGAGHSIREPEHLEAVKQAITDFLQVV